MSFTPRRSAKISVRLAVAAYVVGGGMISEPRVTSPLSLTHRIDQLCTGEGIFQKAN